MNIYKRPPLLSHLHSIEYCLWGTLKQALCKKTRTHLYACTNLLTHSGSPVLPCCIFYWGIVKNVLMDSAGGGRTEIVSIDFIFGRLYRGHLVLQYTLLAALHPQSYTCTIVFPLCMLQFCFIIIWCPLHLPFCYFSLVSQIWNVYECQCFRKSLFSLLYPLFNSLTAFWPSSPVCGFFLFFYVTFSIHHTFFSSPLFTHFFPVILSFQFSASSPVFHPIHPDSLPPCMVVSDASSFITFFLLIFPSFPHFSKKLYPFGEKPLLLSHS